MDQNLTQYIQTGSSAAFQLLVQTHTNAVYSQSLRHLRNPALAEDATQTVFITLSHKAPRISRNAVLAGWLFNTTRHCCATLQRTEARRRKHEKNAMTFRSQIQNDSTDLHADAEPLLNNALEKLRTRERDALLLRYFQGQTMREVGLALGVSEDAAKQQIARALEKLRHWFSKNGVTLPTAALIPFLESAAKPAPAHLLSKLATLNPSRVSARPTWLSAKIAASLMITTVAVGGAAVAVISLADGQSTPINPPSSNTAPIVATTAPSTPDTPLDTLRRLAAAIRADDRPAIAACFLSGGHNSAAMQLTIEQNAAWYHVQRAALTAFNTKDLPLQHFGFNDFPFMNGGFEIMIDKMLQAPTPPPSTIDGDSATVKINLPPELFEGTNHIPAFARWSGASLLFKNDHGHWKMDPDRTFNFTGHLESSNHAADLKKLETRLDGMINDAMEEVAGKIESGEIGSPKAAGDTLDHTVIDAFTICRVTYYTMRLDPLIPGN